MKIRSILYNRKIAIYRKICASLNNWETADWIGVFFK